MWFISDDRAKVILYISWFYKKHTFWSCSLSQTWPSSSIHCLEEWYITFHSQKQPVSLYFILLSPAQSSVIFHSSAKLTYLKCKSYYVTILLEILEFSDNTSKALII